MLYFIKIRIVRHSLARLLKSFLEHIFRDLSSTDNVLEKLDYTLISTNIPLHNLFIVYLDYFMLCKWTHRCATTELNRETAVIMTILEVIIILRL